MKKKIITKHNLKYISNAFQLILVKYLFIFTNIYFIPYKLRMYLVCDWCIVFFLIKNRSRLKKKLY